MMDRRSFIKFIAVMAAGSAALPEQIETFTNYYTINAPPGNGPFLALDEIFFGGIADRSTRLSMCINRGEERLLTLAFNAFGGCLRWAAMPEAKIIARPKELTWSFEQHDIVIGLFPVNGTISYIGPDGRRIYQPINHWSGSI